MNWPRGAAPVHAGSTIDLCCVHLVHRKCIFALQIIASIPYDWPRGRLVACTFCRTLIVPLLMLCATPRRGPYLSGEAWSMALSAVLGITNGYFVSVPMILAPSKVPDEQKELTGEWLFDKRDGHY